MNLIAAVDENWGISFEGKLLFDLPPDLARFKQMTVGKVVVMGAETFRSLPKAPLENRVNIVLSSTSECCGATVVGSLDELFAEIEKYNHDDVFVIGGETVYKQLLNLCECAYVTKIHAGKQADRHMPNLDELPEWELHIRERTQEHNGIKFSYLVYRNELRRSVGIY